MSKQKFGDTTRQDLYEQKEKWKARAKRMRSALQEITSDEVPFHPIIRRYEQTAQEALDEVGEIEKNRETKRLRDACAAIVNGEHDHPHWVTAQKALEDTNNMDVLE